MLKRIIMHLILCGLFQFYPPDLLGQELVQGKKRIDVDYAKTTPLELIETLRDNPSCIVYAENLPVDWIGFDDIPAMIEICESDNPCAPVNPNWSSHLFMRQTTDGAMARRLIGGYATGRFPSHGSAWTVDETRQWWKSMNQHNDTQKVSNTMVLANQGILRVEDHYVVNLQTGRWSFPDNHRNVLEYFRSKNDHAELLNRLGRPEECLAVFVMLNEMHPDKRLLIIGEGAKISTHGCGRVPIRVASGNKEISIDVSLETFGRIVQDYWRPILLNQD